MAFRDSYQLILRARDRLSDPSGETFDDDEMARHLESVVAEYSAYRPYRATTTLATVEGQELYDLPEGCLWVDRVYITDSDESTSDTLADILVDIRESLADYDLHRYRDQLRHRYATYGQPLAVLWNDQLLLYPAPTESGDNLVVEYGALHAKNSAGNYPTVPFGDLASLESLLVARCLMTLATDTAKASSYTLGQVRLDHSYQSPNFHRMGAVLQARTLEALMDAIGGIA
jgi:hypothetical protein